MSRFTDKNHLSTYAYNDADRLASRAAIYRFLELESIDLGEFPFRAEGIAGVVSTFLDPSIGGASLDIGCGNGAYLSLLAAQFDVVVAADLSAGMLAAVPEGRWNKVAADVETLPYSDGTFSVVLANHMLYHCPNIDSALGEIGRVLRPANEGGVLLAATNGDGNMTKCYELLAVAASNVLGEKVEPLVPADSRFTVESGAWALQEQFDSVATNFTRGALVISDQERVEALVAYYGSADDEWTDRYGIEWSDLEQALRNVLADEMQTHREIRIPTSSGVLVAR
jgi:ubiquinone/menaquinone biosynthesis C-methylase UbiE